VTTLRDTLSAVSGLKPKAVDEIFEQVKANGAKLDGCPGPHDFVPVDPARLFHRFRCTKCGGQVDGSAARWYRRGLQHGGKT